MPRSEPSAILTELQDVTSSGVTSVEFEAYVWHDVADDWCFRIPALYIEERHHVQPSVIGWFAANAATQATGAAATISLSVCPSSDVVGHDVDAMAPLTVGSA